MMITNISLACTNLTTVSVILENINCPYPHFDLASPYKTSIYASAQVSTGRVVINEYLPWQSNACGTTSEFVELLNFDPGPIEIGCYIVSNGRYSITIPSNTVLAPGEFYVIAGQDILPQGCGNRDSTVHVNLNWNTCRCTSTPIPTTGDGFMTDGGNGNVNLVLMDPRMNIVDAVTRDLTVDPSVSITTSTVNGGCTPRTYDLNRLTIDYETLGMSTGNANSFARRTDGDCGWVKTPTQSANATNNASGNTASVTYDFSLIGAMDCNGGASSVHIIVKSNDFASIYPMSYTLATDINNIGVFDLNDFYTTGVSTTPPDINVTGLAAGHYRITVASSKGCNLKSFDFTILPCYPVLPVKLIYFKLRSSINQKHVFEWQLNDVKFLSNTTIEKSVDGFSFTAVSSIQDLTSSGLKTYTIEVLVEMDSKYYRLKIFNKDGSFFYAPVLSINGNISYSLNKAYPNPANNQLWLDIAAEKNYTATYQVINASGRTIKSGSVELRKGVNTLPISLQNLSNGFYQVLIDKNNNPTQPISFRFVKQ